MKPDIYYNRLGLKVVAQVPEQPKIYRILEKSQIWVGAMPSVPSWNSILAITFENDAKLS